MMEFAFGVMSACRTPQYNEGLKTLICRRAGSIMAKPTFASVTEVKCSCNFLPDEASNPESPIIFDDQTGEYQFTYQEANCEGLSMLVIYHCPFCGGATPESRRSLLFAVIPQAEEDRLAAILAPIQSIEDAIQILGKPNFDDFVKVHEAERNDKPSSVRHDREIRYENVSDVADLWITECPNGRAFWQLQGKYVGRKSND